MSPPLKFSILSSIICALHWTLVISAEDPIHTDDFQCPNYDCDLANCRLPSCLCPNTSAPLNLKKEIVPQFVIFTFNDVVKREFYDPFTKVFSKNRRNPNGRRIAATMFVSDEEGTGKGQETTDYCLARKLYEQGHELASHTISHRTPQDWWTNDASAVEWKNQLTGQRDNMTRESKLPDKHVRGVRAPFLQAGGEKQFQGIASNKDFMYDSSLLLQSPVVDGGYWPFTLDYRASDLWCESGICPANCYKGLWEVPLTILDGPAGLKCTFLDFCLKDSSVEDIERDLGNIYRQRYEGNRSPLILNFNMRWFQKNSNAEEGLAKFIDEVLKDDDTYMVSIEQLLAYMQTPVPVTEIDSIPLMRPVKKGDERDTKNCKTKRGSSVSSLYLDGDLLVILEAVFFTLVALILIARDSD